MRCFGIPDKRSGESSPSRGWRSLFAALTALAGLYGLVRPAEALELKVFAGVGGFGVTSTMILGRDEVVVVDAQYVRSDAHRLVAELLETRRRVSTVFITHAHPDHFFGSEVIAAAFPEAKFVAAPEVVAAIEKIIPVVQGRRGFKDNPNNAQRPVIPAPLSGASLLIDGEPIQILTGLTGDDAGPATAVFVPSLKTIIAGDIVFEGVHPWTAHSNAVVRKSWIESIRKLEAMKPEAVIAGHRSPAGTNGLAALAATRAYLEAFDAMQANAANPDELVRRMLEQYPALAYPPILRIGAANAYPKQ